MGLRDEELLALIATSMLRHPSQSCILQLFGIAIKQGKPVTMSWHNVVGPNGHISLTSLEKWLSLVGRVLIDHN